MAKKKLNEEQVIKEAAKRFRMLCEYTFVTEEGEGEDAPMPDEGGAPQGGPDMSGGPSMGGMEGGNPNDMGGAPQGDPNMGGNPDMGMEGGDPAAMGDNPEGGAPGFNPEEGAGNPGMGGDPAAMGGDPGMGGEPMQPEDEVIDVDELTQSQEKTEEKVEDVSVTMERGFEKILGVVSKLNKMIDANSANMEELKREMEKRNPTALEKLHMRAANDSYPFNVSPESYWADKEANSNYRIGGDDEPDAEQYTITQGDIDKMTDFNQIAQDLNDASFNQNLLNIFGLR